MFNIISKQLLSLILEKKLTYEHLLASKNNECLAKLCKEWAVKQGYLIGSDLDKVTVWNIKNRVLENDYEVYFEDYLEFTIKATEWIAKEKGLLND